MIRCTSISIFDYPKRLQNLRYETCAPSDDSDLPTHASNITSLVVCIEKNVLRYTVSTHSKTLLLLLLLLLLMIIYMIIMIIVIIKIDITLSVGYPFRINIRSKGFVTLQLTVVGQPLARTHPAQRHAEEALTRVHEHVRTLDRLTEANRVTGQLLSTPPVIPDHVQQLGVQQQRQQQRHLCQQQHQVGSFFHYVITPLQFTVIIMAVNIKNIHV